MTVNGIIEKNELGITAAHEHMLIDIRRFFMPPDALSKAMIAEQPVRLDNIRFLKNDPYAIRDNLIVGDVGTAIDEVRSFKAAGGRSLVDVTMPGIGRDVRFLKAASAELSMNIICGCGFYVEGSQPPWVVEADEKAIEKHLLQEISEGIDGTDIRPGVIGELGTGTEIGTTERKVLIAAGKASLQTGLPIQIHTYPWGVIGLEAAEILVDIGIKPEKICICHVDVEFNMPYIYRLLDIGVYVEFDNFGKEYYIPKRDRAFAGGIFVQDIERAAALKEIIEKGYTKQILVSCDICLKSLLHAYGGSGYDHFLVSMIPMLADEGVSSDAISTLIRDNPADFLDV